MSGSNMASRIAKVLGEHPDLALELYCTASEVADDFGDFGPVLQGDEDGLYSKSTAIIRMTRARDRIIKVLREE